LTREVGSELGIESSDRIELFDGLALGHLGTRLVSGEAGPQQQLGVGHAVEAVAGLPPSELIERQQLRALGAFRLARVEGEVCAVRLERLLERLEQARGRAGTKEGR
jgi:hypothetical protein